MLSPRAQALIVAMGQLDGSDQTEIVCQILVAVRLEGQDKPSWEKTKATLKALLDTPLADEFGLGLDPRAIAAEAVRILEGG